MLNETKVRVVDKSELRTSKQTNMSVLTSFLKKNTKNKMRQTNTIENTNLKEECDRQIDNVPFKFKI